MSIMYDIVVSATLVEDQGTSSCPIWPAIEWLNSHLPFPLSQALEEPVWAGSYKQPVMDDLEELVLKAPWYWPEQVVVILREDAGDEIRIIRPLSTPVEGETV